MALRGGYDRYTSRIMSRRKSDLDIYFDCINAAIGAIGERAPRILHLGCGWDRSGTTNLLPSESQIVGVDLDREACVRYPRDAWLADAGHLPFPDDSFDLVCSEYLIEHLEHPADVMTELARVLRSEGRAILLTPSRWSYKSVAASMTPHAFHELVASKLRPDGREAADVYPTHYKMNSRTDIHQYAAMHGFTVERVVHINNGPTWFRRLPGLFEVGLAYHWLLDRSSRLQELRCGLVVDLRKREPSEALDIMDGPQRSALTTNLVPTCLRCGYPTMARGDAEWECPACRRRYPIEDGVTDARPL
jgi:SAM-dependent methyltransferase